ncbi:LysR family transcriptional regulator [Amaricoccus solimangrovi]|nr:LysR family transcriptional regulator [Amaricoccus solimangrovi]
MTALRAFAALAETGGLSQAGRALNVSHAAVSQQMRALEERLGTTLATREGRGLALTPAGVELARALNSAFGEIEAAVSALTDLERTRPLQVSVTPTFATGWLMPRLVTFQQENPDVEIMINPTAALVPLTPGGVDVAIRYGLGHWPGLEAEPLVPTEVVVVAPPALLAGRSADDPALLADLPWLQETGTNEVTSWLERRGIAAGRKMRITHLPGNLTLDALRRGEPFAAAMPRVFVEEDIAAGRLVVLLADDEPGAGYHIVTRPGVARPPLRAFLSWLRRIRAGEAARETGLGAA